MESLQRDRRLPCWSDPWKRRKRAFSAETRVEEDGDKVYPRDFLNYGHFLLSNFNPDSSECFILFMVITGIDLSFPSFIRSHPTWVIHRWRRNFRRTRARPKATNRWPRAVAVQSQRSTLRRGWSTTMAMEGAQCSAAPPSISTGVIWVTRRTIAQRVPWRVFLVRRGQVSRGLQMQKTLLCLHSSSHADHSLFVPSTPPPSTL